MKLRVVFHEVKLVVAAAAVVVAFVDANDRTMRVGVEEMEMV